MGAINMSEATINEDSCFDATVLGFIGQQVLMIILTVFTFGLAYPWAYASFIKWKTSHTIIDGKRLKFSGSGASLFGKFIIWYLLCIVTLGIYSFWMFNSLERWKISNTRFA